MDMAEECSPLIDRGEYEEPPRSRGFPLLRYLVAHRRYDFRDKAYKQLSDGEFELLDLEHAVLYGAVKKTEVDEQHNSVGNKKYTILGKDTHGYDFYCCAKMIQALDGTLVLIITAHWAN
jgi:hypothetical protein